MVKTSEAVGEESPDDLTIVSWAKPDFRASGQGSHVIRLDLLVQHHLFARRPNRRSHTVCFHSYASRARAAWVGLSSGPTSSVTRGSVLAVATYLHDYYDDDVGSQPQVNKHNAPCMAKTRDPGASAGGRTGGMKPRFICRIIASNASQPKVRLSCRPIKWDNQPPTPKQSLALYLFSPRCTSAVPWL